MNSGTFRDYIKQLREVYNTPSRKLAAALTIEATEKEFISKIENKK